MDAIEPDNRMLNLPKATRILTLRYYHRSPRLLQLPRELRDYVYTLVLAEPALYDKRHRPGCRNYDRDQTSEPPPIIFDGLGLDDGTCRKKCKERSGFGLLMGVCRQIQDEASAIFWKLNIICFGSRQQALAGLTKIPDTARARIRRLAIWDVEHAGPENTPVQPALPRNLAMLPNLKHLELHAEEIPHFLDVLIMLPALNTLRLWQLKSLRYESGEYHWVNVFVGLYRQWEVPECPRLRPTGEWCVPCQDVVEDMRTTAQAWMKEEKREMLNVIIPKLERLQPARDEDGALKMRVTFPGGEKQTVHVWGLPLDTPSARSARRASNIKHRNRRGERRAVVYVEDTQRDGDGAVFGNMRRASRINRVERRVNHEVVLEEREEERVRKARREEKMKSKEKMMKEKVVRRGKAEVAANKKEARKRVGRRAS